MPEQNHNAPEGTPADNGAVTNEIDNLALFTYPMPEVDGFPAFLVGIAADPKHTVEAPIMDSLPETFGGKYAQHFLKVADSSLAKVFLSAPLDKLEITHLALLTGGAPMADLMYFNGEPINQQGVIFWYSEPRQKYYFVHCRGCGIMLAQFLTMEQETWQKISKAAKLSVGSSALN